MSRGKRAAIVIVVIAIVAALGATGAAWASKNKAAKDAAATKNATILADGIQFEYEALQRGTALTVTGVQGEYYKATLSQSGSGDSVQTVSVLVPKSYVRLASETTPAAWTGYATEGANLYATVALSGNAIATLEKDAPVTVENSFAGIVYVKTADGKYGYAAATAINKEKAEEATEDKEESGTASSGSSSNYSYSGGGYSYSYDDGGYDYSGGGDSGASSGGSSGSGSTGGSGGSSGGTQTTTGDGGDISLASIASSAVKNILGVQTAVAASGSETSTTASSMNASATVLGDGVMSYLGFFNRGDVVQVLASSVSTSPSSGTNASASSSASSTTFSNDASNASLSANTVDVVFEGVTKSIERRLVRLEDEAEYTTWVGYAKADAPLYADYKMTSVAQNLALNTELQIVDNLTSCYVVSLNGKYYYVANDKVSTVKNEELKKESEEAAESSEATGTSTNNAGRNYSYSYDYSSDDSGYDYSGGGDSGASSGGSGGGGSSGGSGDSGGGSSGGGSADWTAPVL